MANSFSGSAVIDRPPGEVFDVLADGTNDPKFSPRVLEIAKATDGEPGVGTVYKSKVKDARHDHRARVRAHRVRAAVEDPLNEFEGHGFGKLLLPLALRSARKGADDFAAAIKTAVESS